MPRISLQHTVTALSVVRAMNSAGRERLADEIFKAQPDFLASVLCLGGRGITNENLEVLLNILLTCYEAVRASDLTLPLISDSVQETCLARVVGRSAFIENLSPELSAQAVSDPLNRHEEANLLALVMLQLQEHELTGVTSEAEKLLVLCALNLVETIACVAKDAQPGRRPAVT